ncbi:hypothetical protein AKJ16_DCAP07889 [Drosera capensis]
MSGLPYMSTLKGNAADDGPFTLSSGKGRIIFPRIETPPAEVLEVAGIHRWQRLMSWDIHWDSSQQQLKQQNCKIRLPKPISCCGTTSGSDGSAVDAFCIFVSISTEFIAPIRPLSPIQYASLFVNIVRIATFVLLFSNKNMSSHKT